MRFAHLARCAAAIFLLAAALMVRFFLCLARSHRAIEQPAKLFV